MGFTRCTETYLIDGRLVPVPNYRKSGRGRWPRLHHLPKAHLVARVIGELGNVKIVPGPAVTDAFRADSLLMHMGMDPTNIDAQLWQEIPESLIEGVRSQVREASLQIARQSSQFSNEEAVTGALFSRASGFVRGPDGWRAELEFVEFSKQTKEGETGADVALIIDVLAQDGRRAFKTLWFQSKVVSNRDADLSNLPRLPKQMREMSNHTTAGFGLLYTPLGTVVVGPDFPEGGTDFDQVLAESLRCLWGDQRISVYSNSIDRLRTYHLLITKIW